MGTLSNSDGATGKNVMHYFLHCEFSKSLNFSSDCLKNAQECIIKVKNSRRTEIFQPGNTRLQVFWTASKSLI